MFFFKQKTAYEMRISDWSSDVCSSDLSDEKAEIVKILNNGNVAGMPVLRTMQNGKGELQPRAFQVFGPKVLASRGSYDDQARSEERRVGKECVSTCRHRWSQYN